MWATFPPLTSQPFVEMLPDQADRVRLFGYDLVGLQDLAGVFAVDTSPYVGQPVTLRSALPSVHAVHCVVDMDSESNFAIHLGDQYRLNIATFLNTDPLHPFLVPSQRGIRASIDSDETPMTSVDLAFVTPPFFNWAIPGVSSNPPVNICFGYAYDNPNGLKAYAHLSNITPLIAGQWLGPNFTPPRLVAACGSGTASLLVSVDEEAAFEGEMKIVVQEPVSPFTGFHNPTGFVGFKTMSCALNPFLSCKPYVLERSHTKTSRANDRVASLRSNAVNFAVRATIGTDVALVDCGGHPEFSLPSFGLGIQPRPQMFAVSLAGQPDSTVAYVASSESWRSNCGFSAAHALKASAISVSVTNWDIHSGSPVREVSFDVASIVADAHGNNEYATIIASQGEFWDQLHLQIRIIGEEDVVDALATPLSNVQPRTRFTVVVTIFASFEGQRSVGFFGLSLSAAATKTLTEEEAVAFFEGQALEIETLANAGFEAGKIELTLVGV